MKKDKKVCLYVANKIKGEIFKHISARRMQVHEQQQSRADLEFGFQTFILPRRQPTSRWAAHKCIFAINAREGKGREGKG